MFLCVSWLQNNYFLLVVLCYEGLFLCSGSLQFQVPVIFEFKHFAKIGLVSIVSLSSFFFTFRFRDKRLD